LFFDLIMSNFPPGARNRQSQPQGVKPKTAAAAIALAKSQAYQDAADAPGTLKAYAPTNASVFFGPFRQTPMRPVGSKPGMVMLSASGRQHL